MKKSWTHFCSLEPTINRVFKIFKILFDRVFLSLYLNIHKKFELSRLCRGPEACLAMDRGAYATDESNQGGGIYLPSEYVHVEIRNSMFLPLMKKDLIGGKGDRRHHPHPRLVCYAQGILILMKIFLPSLPKNRVCP